MNQAIIKRQAILKTELTEEPLYRDEENNQKTFSAWQKWAKEKGYRFNYKIGEKGIKIKNSKGGLVTKIFLV